MAYTQVPSYTTLQDTQFIQVSGADGLTTGFQYDAQQRALFSKESQIIYPSFHGATHVAEDPIPFATCDTPGLMSPDDKCKLDALLQTRVGVLGFQGAGFADDGGWLQGDIIFSAGTDFISIERIGNVVRFTVDSPVPLNCGSCDECQSIFMIQDTTDISSVRVPACSGKLPGFNSYGELKVFLFPESTIVDPNNPSLTLNHKGAYPSLIFKRYDDALVPGTAELDVVLKRSSTNNSQTEIGWAFTPGATGSIQCVWFTGKDNDGNQTKFELSPQVDSNILGSILYNGHCITKQMGVIVDYTSTVLSTNQYTLKMWNVDAQKAVGDPFTAKNVWQYANPENTSSGRNPKTILLDSAIDILPIGTIVDIWSFKVGEVSGEPINRYYFSKKPTLNPNHIWTWVGQTQFGDVAISRAEVQPDAGSADKIASAQVSDIRNFEHSMWGLTGFDDPFVLYDIVSTAGTESGDISNQHRAVIDNDLPGLKVVAATTAPDDFSERPVWLWNRRNVCNALIHADIGRPSSSIFTPYDFALRAQIDESETRYARVLEKGMINGLHFIRVTGVHFHDLSSFGSLRILYPNNNRNQIYNYNRKLMFPPQGSIGTEPTGGSEYPLDINNVILMGGANDNVEYPGEIGDVVELLHQEYNCPIVRVECSYNTDTGLINIQFKVGTLDMSLPYEEDVIADDADDFVRGLAPGYAVSAVYSQAGVFSGVGTQPDASPEGFVVYDGGAQIGGSLSEYWNSIDIMLRDNQVWIWWNKLLIPPHANLSANLPTPVNITTPYFTIDTDINRQFGKAGVRMWPGASIRRFDVKTQIGLFSEYTNGQLSIS